MSRVLKLILILCLGSARTAISCSCVEHEGLLEDRVAEAFAIATVVFFGEVESVETVVEKNTMASGRQVSTEAQVAHIKVLRSWKGDKKAGDVVLARTTTTCCLCGLAVKQQERLLVYAYGEAPISLSICSRTTKTDLGSADIPVLERIKRGEPAREPSIRLPEPNIAFKADAPEGARP
jgi:hypothetical protein